MHNRISELREAAKLTQAQLAEACGVSQQFISKVEIAQGSPSMRVAVALAHALHCTIDDLFREEQGRTG